VNRLATEEAMMKRMDVKPKSTGTVNPSDKRHGGILTSVEIINYGVIRSISRDSECLQGTSYDLRLGHGHYVFDKNEKWTPYFLGNDIRKANKNKSIKYSYQSKDNIEELEIPPFGAALIQLQETIDTFTCATAPQGVLIAGRFDLKLGMVKKGLTSQQATQVEPCYRGLLFCFVFNQTGTSVKLKLNDPIATIEFHFVSCYVSQRERILIVNKMKSHNMEKYNGDPYCEQYGIGDIRFFKGELPSHGGLSDFFIKYSNMSHDLHEKENETRNYLKTQIDEATKNLEKHINKQWEDKHQLRMAMIGIFCAIAGILVSILPISCIQSWATGNIDKKSESLIDKIKLANVFYEESQKALEQIRIENEKHRAIHEDNINRRIFNIFEKAISEFIAIRLMTWEAWQKNDRSTTQNRK